MGQSCYICGYHTAGCGTFGLPSNKDKREQWLAALGLDAPKKLSLCSLHFLPQHVSDKGYPDSKPLLVRHAVPCLHLDMDMMKKGKKADQVKEKKADQVKVQ